MSVLLVLILCLFLLFYILTRDVWIRITSAEELILELHLPILAIQIQKDQGDENNKRKNRKTRLSIPAHIRIISATLEKIKTGRVEITRIAIPIDIAKISKGSFFQPIGYQYAIYSVIAYLNSKTDRINIEDNAIILSPDIDKAQFYLTVKPKMYELISAIVTYVYRFKIEKKRAKKEDKYVRE